MKVNGKKMTDFLVMEKILRNLTLHFEYMITVIEE